MTEDITREEALRMYNETIQQKLEETKNKVLDLCVDIDTEQHIIGAVQAAAIGNALTDAKDPRVVVIIDGAYYPLNTIHMDIVDPIFRALEEIVNLGKAEVAKFEANMDPTTKETMGGSWDE